MGLRATQMDVKLQEGLTIFYVFEAHCIDSCKIAQPFFDLEYI
jgi:hypothetical protein